MLWSEEVAKALRHMQKSCRPKVSPCGETTFDLRSNSLGRRGKLVPYDQFYSLLRVAVRSWPRIFKHSPTPLQASQDGGQILDWGMFLARVPDLFTVPRHPTYCANCPF